MAVLRPVECVKWWRMEWRKLVLLEGGWWHARQVRRSKKCFTHLNYPLPALVAHPPSQTPDHHLGKTAYMEGLLPLIPSYSHHPLFHTPLPSTGDGPQAWSTLPPYATALTPCIPVPTFVTCTYISFSPPFPFSLSPFPPSLPSQAS